MQTSVTLHFEPSTANGDPGSLFYQVIHDTKMCVCPSDIHLYNWEWDESRSCFVMSDVNPERRHQLENLFEQHCADMNRWQRIINKMDASNKPYTVEDLVQEYKRLTARRSFFDYLAALIKKTTVRRKERTAETYTQAYYSFQTFLEGKDIDFESLQDHLICDYESYLKQKGLSMNTISFYMRVLRAVYNRGVEEGLTDQKHPFRKVYTGVAKTVKRAINVKYIKELKDLDLNGQPVLAFARDLFLFSFYTRGMSFIDMAYLKKSDIQEGVLTYTRKKTGQQLFIRWEPCMQELVDRHPNADTDYLLPVITRQGDNEHVQYCNALHHYNRKLKIIARMIHLEGKLSFYVARHTWATAAKNSNVPLSIISQGMGHDSETTTRIYLASLDNGLIDDANKKIISLIE